jgi:ribosomal protein S18 acetylase RimI-like enzyme
MISNDGIVKNLYGLYDDLAGHGLVSSGSTGGFEYVRHGGFAWPNMAYRQSWSGPATREELRLLKGSMASGICPRLVILDGEELTAEIRGALAEERFIAATEWVNMAVPVERSARSGKQDLLQCREINADDPGEWSHWASVVSDVLFKNQPLDPTLFRQPAIKKQFILMTGYSRGIPVATCLLYLAENAGLYMVATLPAFQGKGFGRQLMEHAQVAAGARGYEFVMLHSTKTGLNFYIRMGFKNFGKLFLYYSMQ